jgi:hypothetical protein
MKTTKITAIVSLVLILFGTNLLNAGNTIGKPRMIIGMNLVRYQVNVHLPFDVRLCNLWVIEVTDAKGNLVAPAQGYSELTDTYIFYEKGPVTGTRVARLVLSTTTMHYNCDPEFNVYPDFKTGTFAVGQTVTFDLYPSNIQPPKP